MALDLQQRATQHGHRRPDPRYETKNSRVNSTAGPHQKWGDYHDNAVAGSFFQLLKRERIRRQTYPTREAARHDVFEYIELFDNTKRKHTNNGMLSPVDFEERQLKLKKAGV